MFGHRRPIYIFTEELSENEKKLTQYSYKLVTDDILTASPLWIPYGHIRRTVSHQE